jgi:anti-anti-sigma factor
VDISGRPLEGRAIIRVTGRLVANCDRKLLFVRRAVVRLLDEGVMHLVLDFGGVSDIDAAGLGTLVGLYRTVVRFGGTLTLVGPNARVRALLALTRLDTVLALAPRVSGASNGTALLSHSSFLARPELE